MDESNNTRVDLIELALKAHLLNYIDNETPRRYFIDGNAGVEEIEAFAKSLTDEIERLQDKCNKQAMILRRMYVEQFPDTWFVCGEHGEKDQNNLPKYIEVCPAYGVDWTQLYERTERTISGMGS